MSRASTEEVKEVGVQPEQPEAPKAVEEVKVETPVTPEQPVPEVKVETPEAPEEVKAQDPVPEAPKEPEPEVKHPDLEKLTHKIQELRDDNKALQARIETMELNQRLVKSGVRESEMDVLTLVIEKEKSQNKDYDEKKFLARMKAEKPYLFMVGDTVTNDERKVETKTVYTPAEAAKRASDILKGWTRN